MAFWSSCLLEQMRQRSFQNGLYPPIYIQPYLNLDLPRPLKCKPCDESLFPLFLDLYSYQSSLRPPSLSSYRVFHRLNSCWILMILRTKWRTGRPPHTQVAWDLISHTLDQALTWAGTISVQRDPAIPLLLAILDMPPMRPCFSKILYMSLASTLRRLTLHCVNKLTLRIQRAL